MQTALDNRLKDETSVYLWASTSRDARGRISGELYRNGLLNIKYFNKDGTVKRIKSGTGDKLVQDIRYEYNEDAQVINRYDKLNDVKQYYSYDEEGRIDSWDYESKDKSIQEEYEYDERDNLIRRGESIYEYNTKNQLIAYNEKEDFNYDENGNMLRGVDKSYLYNTKEMVKEIRDKKGNKIKLYYDESDNLVKKEINEEKVIYYIGNYELERDKREDKITMRHLIRVDKRVVAVHEKSLINNKKQLDKTVYIHMDMQNSTTLITDNKARVVSRIEYDPFGRKIKDTREIDSIDTQKIRGYTNHRNMEETDLIDMQARLYDPNIARFISTDSIIPDEDNIRAYNRYAYVYNNPVNYIDPDGHNPFAIFAIGAAIFSIGVTTDNPDLAKVATVVGSVMMGTSGAAGGSAAANGALTGFTTGFISSGGELDQAVENGIISSASAFMANEIGHGTGKEWD